MKKFLSFGVVISLLCLTSHAWPAPSSPIMSYETDGLNIRVSWTEVPEATGYTLYYAPYPYTGVDTIGSMDMTTANSFTIDLWDGAKYYIAVRAYDSQESSGYSNIELFNINQNINSVSLPLPNQKLGVFYYPWYANPTNNPDPQGLWRGWEANDNQPTEDIASDFYPALGPYSSADRDIVRQHFQWIREAGIGVVITSWWGINSFEDDRVPLLLDLAAQYGLKISFHIEPYGTRTSESLVEDVQYIYSQYGNHPAFFRTSETSFQSPNTQTKGMFFVWSTVVANYNLPPVEPSYWTKALDDIHDLSDGAIMIATSYDPGWVATSHFDGAYNYASVTDNPESLFQWQSNLPRNAWFVPSVLPGFTTERSLSKDNPPEDFLSLPRENGQTYLDQWEKVASSAIEPAFVTITSFNEWMEGTQIEPAISGEQDSVGVYYKDYGTLGENWYLETTLEISKQLQTLNWPDSCPSQINFKTTSDWAEFELNSGAEWLYLNVKSASTNTTVADIVGDGLLHLVQPIELAEQGTESTMAVNFDLVLRHNNPTITWRGQSGGIGESQVQLLSESGEIIETFRWSGDGNRNFTLDSADLPCSD